MRRTSTIRGSVLLAALTACGTVMGQNQAPNQGGIMVPPEGSFYHGVFAGAGEGEEDACTPQTLSAYETAAGKRVAWVSFSHEWGTGRAFPFETASWIRARGGVPFIRLMLRSDPDTDRAEPLYTLTAINRGKFDADLRAWGRAARAFATPLIVEWGTEVNGSWFAWNGTWNGGRGRGPALFRAAYRRIVQIIRRTGARNITWTFHVVSHDAPNATWNRMENYYPGNDVVDWVGLSVYGPEAPEDDAGDYATFEESMDDMVARLTRRAPNKPIFLFEFGVTQNHPQVDAAEWVDNALDQLLSGRWPEVRGFCYMNDAWESGEGPEDDTEMRIQADPRVADVFQSRLASPNVLDRPILR